MKSIRRRKSLVFSRLAAALLLVGLVITIQRTSAFDVSFPALNGTNFSFSFTTTTSNLYTIQAANALGTGWTDVTNRAGTGSTIAFTAQSSGAQRFFRLCVVPYQPVTLTPQTPTMPDGAVSLPDVVVGESYLGEIIPQGTGPFSLQVNGSLPQGVVFTVISNDTSAALVRLTSDGSGVTPGHRQRVVIAVTDAASVTIEKTYDVRIIAPAPQIVTSATVLKAGQAATISVVATNGTGPLTWSLASGTLPSGMSLSQAGAISGTPAAAAAELNETGLHTNVFRVTDSHTDRVTGASAPRMATRTVIQTVRFSYQLNIWAQRSNGPAMGFSCSGCHGSFFPPDVASSSALTLINVESDPEAICADRVYVARGSPATSLLVAKLRSNPACGTRMPQGGPFFSETRLRRLERWIVELGPNDTD